MSLPPLTVIPAGAGSGKTYTIQDRLSTWLEDGAIAPERIVAVTFTEAAASELLDRIRGALVQRGLHNEALRLDRAYISTIHGFGLRLLREFPFEAQVSPSLRPLTDDEERILVGNALPFTEQADVVMSSLDHYGYRYEWGSGRSAEDVFRGRLLDMIARLRSIGRETPDLSLAQPLREAIWQTYGETGDRHVLETDLSQACQNLLARFPDDLSVDFPDNNAASSALRSDHVRLSLGATGDALASDWRLWNSLRSLRTSARGSALPEGYDELAAEVMASADALPRHPGPRDDAVAHGLAMLGAAQDCLARYATEKRRRGLLDYGDMVALAYRLLSDAPEARAALRERVDCLVIDEFQDTNPIQFSLLWSLHRAGVPALVVGDVKQAIMGFQGADARLFAELERQEPDAVDPLRCNWRTQAPLMTVLNAMGQRLFPSTYVDLESRAPFASELEPLEIMVTEGTKVGESLDALQWTLADRVRALLADPSARVWDKESKEHRRVRGEDIAILCRTGGGIAKYAAALRRAGIRPRVALDGWHDSRVVQLATHALAFVADPFDRHAALYLAVTELGSHDLDSALAALLDGRALEEPVLNALAPVIDGSPDRTVDELVGVTIDALELWDRIADWPDTARARANLLRLRAEAESFVDADRDALASGGFYGSDLKTFLAWLPTRSESDDSQPAPRVRDEDAVQVSTWHSAKGREWPIVIVGTMCTKVEPRLPSLRVQYGGFDDLERMLDAASIEFTPAFHARETTEAFKLSLMDDERANARRLLYVAMTRAREKLILEWPSYLEHKDYETCWDLLRDEAELAIGDGTLSIGDETIPCRIVSAVAPPETGESDVAVAPMPVIGRRALSRRALPSGLTPESVAPSELHEPLSAGRPVRLVHYGVPLVAQIDVRGAERGDLLHRCFEILSGHPERVARVGAAVHYDLDEDDLASIADAVVLFDQWLASEFGDAVVGREVPLLALSKAGSVVSGFVDVVVETADGLWVVDHKSDRVKDRESRFIEYLPQLQAYAYALGAARPDKPVHGVAINWITYGEMMVMEL